jgi:hypothetical protein
MPAKIGPQPAPPSPARTRAARTCAPPAPRLPAHAAQGQCPGATARRRLCARTPSLRPRASAPRPALPDSHVDYYCPLGGTRVRVVGRTVRGRTEPAGLGASDQEDWGVRSGGQRRDTHSRSGGSDAPAHDGRRLSIGRTVAWSITAPMRATGVRVAGGVLGWSVRAHGAGRVGASGHEPPGEWLCYSVARSWPRPPRGGGGSDARAHDGRRARMDRSRSCRQ